MEKAIFTLTATSSFSNKYGMGKMRTTNQMTQTMEFERFDNPKPDFFNHLNIRFTHNNIEYCAEIDARFFDLQADESTFCFLFEGFENQFFELEMFADKTSILKEYEDYEDMQDDYYTLIKDYSLVIID